MRIISITVLTLLMLASRASAAPDDDYSRLADDYLAGYLAWRPQGAVAMGFHEFDGKTTDYSRQSIEAEHARLRKFHELLSRIESKSLSPKLSRESRVLMAAIDSELFSFEVMRPMTRNPMTYGGGFDLNVYAKRDFAPKADRLRSAIAVLRQIPDALKHGRANLEEKLPRTYVKFGIEQAEGSADFFTRDLLEAFSDVKDEALQADLKQASDTAAKAMTEFAQWLKTDRQPKATDDFPIGRDNYVRMLRGGELLTQSPEEILAVGLAELKREQDRFDAAAKVIDPSKPAVEVYQQIQRDHPTAETLISDTAKHLEQIRQFLADRTLIRFVTDVRVKVEPTPKFQRAGTFASMDSPGPFETKATESFYYVTPTEPEWDAKRKEEWLTSMNYYTTDVTSIHEAYPGHYEQAMHLKASDASKIDKAFGSYAFGEGWAHYCEQMVLDEGFPGGDDKIVAAKYRLAQSGEALLRLCRLCASVTMHCQGMSVDDATKFFMENCHYEEAPSRAEAERGTYDPGYCFYTIGKLQILKLREDYRKQQGADFSLMKFHDELLGHGQPPLRLLREVLLKDSKTWDASLPQR